MCGSPSQGWLDDEASRQITLAGHHRCQRVFSTLFATIHFCVFCCRSGIYGAYSCRQPSNGPCTLLTSGICFKVLTIGFSEYTPTECRKRAGVLSVLVSLTLAFCPLRYIINLALLFSFVFLYNARRSPHPEQLE